MLLGKWGKNVNAISIDERDSLRDCKINGPPVSRLTRINWSADKRLKLYDTEQSDWSSGISFVNDTSVSHNRQNNRKQWG